MVNLCVYEKFLSYCPIPTLSTKLNTHSVSQKVAPPQKKTFCDIFIHGKPM